ncbi:hypothetical protein PR202_gb21651 [Eleusine coracana subsp. coracana]|uniref:Uncharacterized protein n=1 Tax=Eleusine coracana subsp. coracana TaxID=191504 RepID=A0AAV5FBP1_ELECO|nr:hypothetical protein PR202_gb21651 [Eleusine coracana subsp. coracana]
MGTYCLDTAGGYTWSKVGDWTLPFRGKVEYVPELKLWFGLSAYGQQLAAADLSNLDSQPQIMGAWEELINRLEEWRERPDAQIVNMGSGRFCVARPLPCAKHLFPVVLVYGKHSSVTCSKSWLALEEDAAAAMA